MGQEGPFLFYFELPVNTFGLSDAPDLDCVIISREERLESLYILHK